VQNVLKKIELKNFEGNIETHDVTGKLVIIRGAKDHDSAFVTKEFMRAGARLVIYAEDGIKIEEVDRKTLNGIGLDFIEKSIVDDPAHPINKGDGDEALSIRGALSSKR
jgi:hypothetical protein